MRIRVENDTPSEPIELIVSGFASVQSDTRDRYYLSAGQVRESSDLEEVNRLLKEGWEALVVQDSSAPIFILGR